MANFGDRIKETTATTGTGTLDLDGAPTGFRGFAEGFATATAEISYLIVDDPDNPTQYEYGKGTFTTGTPNTLARDTVEGSSNGDAKVSWTAGTKTVIATPTSADFAALSTAGNWAPKSALVRVITANDSQVAADDGKLIDADSSASSPATLTYTLLAVATAGDGFVVTVKNTGATGAVVIEGNGAETIDGSLNFTLAEQFSTIQLRCDGTEWHVVGKMITPGVVSVTGSYTVAAEDDTRLLLADASAASPAAITVTLGSAATLGEGFSVSVKNVGATGTVTITTSNSPTDDIDGQASRALNSQYTDMSLRCDGATFHRVAITDSGNLPRGYISGLTLSNDADSPGDSDHDIDISAGECRGADDDEDIILSAITKQIDATWAAGTDAGGLSSSLTAPANNTWYHLHAIIVAGSADVGFDTSITAANLVADHSATAYRRIGSVLTDGTANIIAFTQAGDEFIWTAPVTDFGSDPGTSENTTTLTVPTGLSVLANTIVNQEGDGRGHLYHPNVTGTATNGMSRAETSGSTGAQALVRTDVSAQIQHIWEAGITTLTLITMSWFDDRGRNG